MFSARRAILASRPFLASRAVLGPGTCRALTLACAAWLTIAVAAFAGGGPENVLLVVNSNSDSSKAIANHYIHLRKIPPNNVVYIDWQGSLDAVRGTVFRDQILQPVLEAIDERRLGNQIDYVVYSSDFPYRVNFQNLFSDEEFPPMFRPHGSLTGLTYLAPAVMAKSPAVVMPGINWYVPGPNAANLGQCQQVSNVSSRGFRSRYLWDKDGQRTTDASQGQRYLLSTMLGYTHGRGNTVDEVLRYLQRSAAADGRRPRGTVYFMKNNNIRSKTRHDCYDDVAARLNQMGVRAQVLSGVLPNNARDVIGMMVGSANFDLAAAGNTIQPGAICEHLTSTGGVLHSDGAQTPLTEFLKHGAAGASGTIAEPHSIQAKFPLPSLHLHYARGCSLAEAFYQSVSGPYQLLIVGDPLCQPWAVAPQVAVQGIEAGDEVQGSLSITPTGAGVGVFELFVDGRIVARSQPGATVTLDTTKLADGYHELRVVGVRNNAIETQGREIVPFTVNNHDAALEFTVMPEKRVPAAGAVRCQVRQPGATAIVIRQNSRELARVTGEAGEVDIPAATLGRGPVALEAASEGEVAATAPPVWIMVEPSVTLPLLGQPG